MKRFNLIAGLGASLALCMLVACSNKVSDSSPAHKAAKSGVMDKAAAEQDEPEAMNPINAAAPAGGEASCASDADCTLIPTHGCYGCGAVGGSHKAVNKATQEAFVRANMQKCMAEFQKNPSKRDAETKGSCQFGGARCDNGTCVLKVLSAAERQAEDQRIQRIQQMQQQAQQSQEGQQGGGQGQPMGRAQGQPQ